MKQISKILFITLLLILQISCGTVAHIDPIHMSVSENDSIGKKSVYILENFREIYWKDNGIHFIGSQAESDEVLERNYDINKKLPEDGLILVSFEREYKTVEMLKMLKPKLKEMILLGGATITPEKKSADYIIYAEFTFGPTTMPAYAERQLLESTGKRMATLGLVPTGYYVIRNDYQLELILKDKNKNIIAQKKYIVSNSVEQSISDLNFSQREINTESAVKLFKNSLNKNLSHFLSIVKSNQIIKKTI